MPELPEVERVRQSIEEVVSGATVNRATLHRRDVLVIPGDPEGGFSRNRTRYRPKRASPAHLLQGLTLRGAHRRGKQLALVSSKGPAVIVHLGMTGQVRRVAEGARLPQTDHIHATWRLTAADGSRWRLVFRDPRRFGGLWHVPDSASLTERWSALGPDALTLTPTALAEVCRGAKRAVKAVLLDQRAVAGVGNIYADEACFAAGIDPHRTATTLTPHEIESLAAEVRRILADAIERGGSTLRDYVDAEGTQGGAQLVHRVYARAGLPCTQCGGVLSTDRLAQRATVWCPRCQG